jgi:hypothetical protein
MGEIEIGGHVARTVKMTNAYNILVLQHEMERLL